MARSMLRRAASIMAVAVLPAACSGGSAIGPDVDSEAAMEVFSDDLQHGGAVPVEFTCDGDDRTPGLSWEGLPDGTVEVVVVVDDPDAPRGTFTHWTVWGLRSTDSPLTGQAPPHAVQGSNDFGGVGYRGPCPPRGDQPHRYRFRVLSLDAPVELQAGASPADLAGAIEGHVLGQGALEATYGR